MVKEGIVDVQNQQFLSRPRLIKNFDFIALHSFFNFAQVFLTKFDGKGLKTMNPV